MKFAVFLKDNSSFVKRNYEEKLYHFIDINLSTALRL